MLARRHDRDPNGTYRHKRHAAHIRNTYIPGSYAQSHSTDPHGHQSGTGRPAPCPRTSACPGPWMWRWPCTPAGSRTTDWPSYPRCCSPLPTAVTRWRPRLVSRLAEEVATMGLAALADLDLLDRPAEVV